MTNDNDRAPMLAATFSEPSRAGTLVKQLLDAGVASERVGVLMADSAEARQLLEDGPGSASEAGAIGSAVGATLFGLAAVALAGPVGVLAAGPVAALAAGATAGAGAGGLLGAFIGRGIPENEAALRVEQVHNGGALVTYELADGDDVEHLRAVFDRCGSVDVFRI